MMVSFLYYRHLIYFVLILSIIKEKDGAEDKLQKVDYQPDGISCRRLSNFCYCAGPLSLRNKYIPCKPCAIIKNECVETCPESNLRTTNGNCTTACPTFEPYSMNDGKIRHCVSECPKQYFLQESQCTRCAKECQEGCTSNGTSVDNCLNRCSYAQHYDSCVLTCPNETVRISDTCMVPHCCPLVIHENDCIPNCPVGTYQRKDDTGIQLCSLCHTQCAKSCTGPGTDQCGRCKHLKHGNHCTEACPLEATWISNGQCQSFCPRFKSNKTCVDTCPKHTFQFHNKCISSCPKNAPFKYEDSCHPLCPKFRINDSCVETCPNGRYGFNHSCVAQCPLIARYTDGNECISSCDKLKYKTSCVSECPKHFYVSRNECVSSCSTWEPFRNDSHCLKNCGSHLQLPSSRETVCVKSCPSRYYNENQTCTRVCSPKHPYKNPKTRECEANCTLYLLQGQCRETCPRFLFAYQHQCLRKCPTGLLHYTGKSSGQCVPSCPSEALYRNNNRCVSCCPRYAVKNNCTESCLNNMFAHYAKRGKGCEFLQCVFKCPDNTFSSFNTCEPKCQYNEYAYNGTCISKCPLEARFVLRDKYARCVGKCPANFVISPANERKWPSVDTCEKNCNSYNTGSKIYNGTCIPECPSDYPLILVSRNTCVERCPLGTFYFRNTCVTKCRAGYKRLVSNMTCISSCPKDVQFVFNNTCVAACPSGTLHFQNSCVSKCNFGFKMFMLNTTCVSSCPESAKFVFNGTCASVCPHETIYLDKTCVNQCTFPYKEFNRTCVMTCPREKPFAVNNTCANECPSKTFLHTGDHGVECLHQCPEETKYRDGRNCTSCCPSHSLSDNCTEGCPKGMLKRETSNANCTWIDCVPKCPAYHYNSKCTSCCPKYSERNSCVDSCPESTLFQSNLSSGECKWIKCNQNCPIGQVAYGNRCVNTASCKAPWGIAFNYKKCSKSCDRNENEHDLQHLNKSLSLFMGLKFVSHLLQYRTCLKQRQSCDVNKVILKMFSNETVNLYQFIQNNSNAAFLCLPHSKHAFWPHAKYHISFLIGMFFLILIFPICHCTRKRQCNRLLKEGFQLKSSPNTLQEGDSWITQAETGEHSPTADLDSDNISQVTLLQSTQVQLYRCVTPPSPVVSPEELPLNRRTRELYSDEETSGDDRQDRWKQPGEKWKKEYMGGKSLEKIPLLAETKF